jgi:autotransporter-associated beta strand protein
VVAALVGLCLVQASARGAVYDWALAGTPGDWAVPANWGASTLPTASDTAWIINGGTATVDMSGAACNTLYVGGVGGGTVQMTAGTFAATSEYVGCGGAGFFSQSGGTNTVGTLGLGYDSGGNGVYNLDGGTLIASAITSGALVSPYEGGPAWLSLGGGTLQAGGNFSTPVSVVLPTAGANTTIDTAGHTLTLANSVSGPGGLIKTDAGTLMLSAANFYTGTTLISGGTLALGSSAALEGSTLDTSGAGTLSCGSLSAVLLGGLAGPGSISLTNTAGSAIALSVGGNGLGGAYSGSLGGAGSLAKIGCGVLTLGGENTYHGTTAVNGGTLLLDFSAPGAPAAGVINNSGNYSALRLGGGMLAIQGAASGPANSQQFNGLTLTADASTIQLNANGNANIPTLSVGAFTATAAGSTLLVDTSLGGTVTTTSALPALGVYGNGRAVFYDGSGYNWPTTNSTGSPFVLSGATAAALNMPLPGSGATSTTNYLLAGSASLTASETAGTLQLSPTASGMSLAISSGNMLTVATGGLLFTGTNDYTISGGSITAGNGSGAYELIVQQYAANNNLTITSPVVNCGSYTTSLTKAGPGTLTLSASNNSYSGGTSVLAGTLVLGGNVTGNNVLVGGSGAAAFTQSAGTNTINSNLYLGSNPGGGGVYTMSGASSLSAGYEYLGYSGSGSFTQSAGSNAASYGLYLGYNPGSSGTYSLTGGSLGTQRPGLYVGFYGTGSFTQSGGTNTAGQSFSGGVTLGTCPGSSGTYHLETGGLLSANAEDVGWQGAGAFTQSGGTNAVGSLYLGYNPGSSGTYNLTGGSLGAVDDGLYVGYSGTGTFTQSGGTNTISGAYFGALYLGNWAGSSGSYYLSSTGLLSAPSEYVGPSGTGAFTQSGGTNVTMFLFLGHGGNGAGSYYLTGGSLSAGTLEIASNAGTGTFTQSGGTAAVSALWVGVDGCGCYSLSQSGVLAAVSEYLGAAAPATACFQQTGGSNSTTYLSIGGSNARYLLSGGTLQINGGLASTGTLDGGGGTGVLSIANSSLVDFSQGNIVNAGSASLTIGAGSLVIVPSGGFNPGAIFGNYSTTGPIFFHTSGTTLTVAPGQFLGGCGTINDPVNCQGTLAASPSGFLNLTAGLSISGTGSANLGSGSLTSNGTASGLAGGSLAAATLWVGSSGTGTFTQSGGTSTILGSLFQGALFLGGASGDSGTYNLSGGLLSLSSTAPPLCVGYGGIGNFTQTGGTAVLGATLCLGYNPGGSGALNLGSAGSFSAGSEYVGYYGTGTFTQSGGTNTTPALCLAFSSGSSGTYNLNGGALIVGCVTQGSALTGSGSATFNLGGGTLQLTGPWVSTMPLVLTGSGGNATINTGGYTLSLLGGLSGPGGLNVLGGGTLNLYAPASYSGPTTVAAGTLRLPATFTVSGFGGNGTGWQVDAPSTAITGDVFTLTDNSYYEAHGAFYTLKISPTNGFAASFTYTAGGAKQGEGVAFVLQDDPRGPTALGGGFTYLGYGGGTGNSIVQSAAIELNIDPSYTVGSRYATNGGTGGYASVLPVSLNSGDPINVSLVYDPAAQTITETLSDPVASTSKILTWSGVNLQSVLGGNMAYVGFTGATGYLAATQAISNFSLTATCATSSNNLLPIGTDLSIAAGATLDLAGANQTLGSLSGPAGASVLLGSGTLTTGGDNASTTFGGSISGSGGVVQTGTGTFTLAGSNAYGGGTSVVSGVLAVENPAAIPSGGLLSIGASGSVVLGAPGYTELEAIFGGAPLTPLTSGGGAAAGEGATGGPGAVPEPGTLALLAAAAAVCGLAAAGWRRKGKPATA